MSMAWAISGRSSRWTWWSGAAIAADPSPSMAFSPLPRCFRSWKTPLWASAWLITRRSWSVVLRRPSSAPLCSALCASR
eukprot:1403807-Alexandrium_andersonii.AAC.1